MFQLQISFVLNSVTTQVDIRVNGQTVETYMADTVSGTQSRASEVAVKDGRVEEEEVCGGSHTRPLSELAFVRSGDKGDTANIGKRSDKCMYFTGSAHVTWGHTQLVNVELCCCCFDIQVLFRCY